MRQTKVCMVRIKTKFYITGKISFKWLLFDTIGKSPIQHPTKSLWRTKIVNDFQLITFSTKKLYHKCLTVTCSEKETCFMILHKVQGPREAFFIHMQQKTAVLHMDIRCCTWLTHETLQEIQFFQQKNSAKTLQQNPGKSFSCIKSQLSMRAQKVLYV